MTESELYERYDEELQKLIDKNHVKLTHDDRQLIEIFRKFYILEIQEAEKRGIASVAWYLHGKIGKMSIEILRQLEAESEVKNDNI